MNISRTVKGGKPDEVRQTQDHKKNYLGCPEGEESADEWWRPAGRGAVQVDGRSAPRKDGGGEAGEKRVRSGVDG